MSAEMTLPSSSNDRLMFCASVNVNPAFPKKDQLVCLEWTAKKLLGPAMSSLRYLSGFRQQCLLPSCRCPSSQYETTHLGCSPDVPPIHSGEKRNRARIPVQPHPSLAQSHSTAAPMSCELPVAPVLLMRSLPAKSQSVSLPTVRTPVAWSVVAACTISRQCELCNSTQIILGENITCTHFCDMIPHF